MYDCTLTHIQVTSIEIVHKRACTIYIYIKQSDTTKFEVNFDHNQFQQVQNPDSPLDMTMRLCYSEILY